MSEDEIGVDVVIENEEGSIDIQSDVLKGDKGDKGDPTATIEINQVLTGEAGTEVKIDNIGTDVNMKLNITIPRGDTGEQGYTPIKGTDYFTNEEIQQIKNKVLDEVNQFSVVVVSELPEENIKEKTIYLVPNSKQAEKNIYDECIYVNNDWEYIGTTEVDLSNYYDKTEIDEKLEETSGQGIPTNAVIDYEGDTVPEGYEEVEDKNTYSTEEQKIGTWIDGKPLYRKVVVVNSIVYNNILSAYAITQINNLDNIIEINGVLWNSSRSFCHQLPYVNNDGLASRIYYDINDNSFHFISADTWSNAKLVVLIEYTKTTD